MSLPVAGADYVTSQLVAATNQTATTLIFASPTEPWPVFDATHLYFYITLVDEPSYIADSVPPTQREIFKVSSYAQTANGWELTGVRGSGGTTAQIWAVGAVAEIRPCAQWLEDLKGGLGGTITVTDGITTVDPTSILNFTSNATVTDAGGGQADVAITGGGGGGAPTDATYVTMSLNGTLTQERVLTAGTGITITDGGANSTVTIANSQTSMVQAQYVTMALDGALTSERVLTAGTGISITDNGANGTVVIASTAGGGLSGEEFTTSSTFTVPIGVSALWITMIGGGGGGSTRITSFGGGGGGSGEYCMNFPIPATPGASITVTIGAGGAGGAAGSANVGTAGGTTSFGSFSVGGGGGGSSSNSGAGGGPGGAASVHNVGFPGLLGTAESPVHFGGSAGGGGDDNPALDGASGGPGPGFVFGAAGGASITGQGGGGGGATSPWGLGGIGGDGGVAGTSANAAHYGAGGGGAGGLSGSAAAAGSGAPGYVLVTWV